MPGFHHSVTVLPLPFRRSAVVKFRCSVQISKNIPLRYSHKQQKTRNCSGNGVQKRQRLTATAKRQWKNDKGMVETRHKPVLNLPSVQLSSVTSSCISEYIVYKWLVSLVNVTAAEFPQDALTLLKRFSN